MVEKKRDGFDDFTKIRCYGDEKKRATQALRATPFTLSDYLRKCLADLAAGRVKVVQRPKQPAGK